MESICPAKVWHDGWGCGGLAGPIYEQIRTGVMGGGYVQVDETPIEYLEPGYGQTRQGYLWTYRPPGEGCGLRLADQSCRRRAWIT